MKSSRGFIVPLLLVLIAVLVVGGGMYQYLQNKKTDQMDQNFVPGPYWKSTEVQLNKTASSPRAATSTAPDEPIAIVVPKFQGCPYFYKDKNHVYIQGTQSEGGYRVPLTREVLEQADPNSFSVLGQSDGLADFDCNYSRDKNYVFFGPHIILGADPTTFRGFNVHNMTHDNSAVYFQGTKIDLQGSQAKLLQPPQTSGEKSFYILDATKVYAFKSNPGLDGVDDYSYWQIPGAAASTFHIATSTPGIDAEDNVHSYHLGNIVQ